MTTPHTEYEELSLTSVTGLQTVFRNVQVLYQRGLATEATLLIQSSDAHAKTFHTAYRTLRSEIERCVNVLQSGTRLLETDGRTLQALYDAFVHAEAALSRYVASPQLVSSVAPLPKNDVAPTSPPPPLPPSTTKDVQLPPATRYDEPVTVPVRTSVKLPVQSVGVAVPIGHEPKKKKRRRKKKSGGSSPAVASSGSGNVMAGVTAAPPEWTTLQACATQARQLVSSLKRRSEQYADDVLLSTILDIERELSTIMRDARTIVADEQTPYRVEKLSHYLTLAETSVAELQTLDWSHTAAAPADQISAIPEAAAVVVSATDVSDSVPRQEAQISFVPTTITAATQKPIARSVPKQLVSLARPDSIHTEFSLTKSYLTAPRYQAHISKHYSSYSAFERLLDASITTLEAQTIDGIERWLGDTGASAFHYICDMSIEAFLQFVQQPYEVITATLRAENIKYETLLIWRNLYDEMSAAVSLPRTATYGQLFAQFMIETDIASFEADE